MPAEVTSTLWRLASTMGDRAHVDENEPNAEQELHVECRRRRRKLCR